MSLTEQQLEVCRRIGRESRTTDPVPAHVYDDVARIQVLAEKRQVGERAVAS